MPSLLPLPLASSDPGTERIAELKTLFPEAFADGKINFDRLRLALGDAVDTGRERYGLSWAGKADAIRAIQIPSAGTLTPDREQSVNFDTTENLIIEGDNLEVLKLLQKSYYGKVKMIYIDPPYNTGNEFIYPDNFREGLQDYLRYSGQVQDDGTLASSTVDREGRVHSSWLSMMYPRLFLAKNLLNDDGVIFVSIDDHEVHNLRLLMDEVFGEENFIAPFIWKSRQIVDSRSQNGVSNDHEYIFVYKKSASGQVRGKKIDLTKYSNPDNDSRGAWMSNSILGLATASQRPNLHYDLIDPETGIAYPCPPDSGWRYSKTTLDEKMRDNRIVFPRKPDGRPRERKFLNELENEYTGFSSILNNEIGYTLHGTREVRDILGENIFAFPKPATLLKSFLEQATSIGTHDIVLDLFAGSGTTAQAVLELNKEDGGNRRYILVQLPEKTDNKQFPTIADITRERVRRVIDKMKTADAGKLPIDEDTPDRGFKAFRLTSSNFKVWDGEAVQTDASELAVQLEAFASNILPSATPDAMLYEIMLNAGLEIGASRETVMMGGQVVENIGNGALLVCLEPDIHLATLRAMIAARPRMVVCLDTALHGDDALLTNAELEAKAAKDVTFYTV